MPSETPTRADDDFIRFPCAECGKPLKAPPESAGKKVKCRHCGHSQHVPRSPAMGSMPAPVETGDQDQQRTKPKPNRVRSPKSSGTLGVIALVLAIASLPAWLVGPFHYDEYAAVRWVVLGIALGAVGFGFAAEQTRKGRIVGIVGLVIGTCVLFAWGACFLLGYWPTTEQRERYQSCLAAINKRTAALDAVLVSDSPDNLRQLDEATKELKLELDQVDQLRPAAKTRLLKRFRTECGESRDRLLQTIQSQGKIVSPNSRILVISRQMNDVQRNAMFNSFSQTGKAFDPLSMYLKLGVPQGKDGELLWED